MGIFDVFKKQFIDVIQWTEDADGVLALRYPMQDKEIQNGAKLTVRESQIALFVNEGQVADVFEPGNYTLTTKTLPVLTALKNWDKLFQSPFKSDVYFFVTRDQLDQRWGTATPITLRDKEFGPIRLRAHGNFSYKVKNPKVFHSKVSGTREIYKTSDLEAQLRSAIITELASFFGEGTIAFLDMAANQKKFSETLKTALTELFAGYGLQLQTFTVQSLSLPEEIQKYLDKATSMKMLGDLKKYVQFQAADSLGNMGGGDGGGAMGTGVGLGAGAAVGQVLAASLGQGASGGTTDSDDPLKTIDRLHDLLKKKIITQAEFDAKKAELLKKIS